MGMSVGGNKGSISEPNIVPLIDVLLVLIIIFMVITPKTPTGWMRLCLSPPPPNQKQTAAMIEKTIVVQVTAERRMKINQDETTWDELGPQLADIFKQRAEKVAFVKGDDDVEFARSRPGNRHHAGFGNR